MRREFLMKVLQAGMYQTKHHFYRTREGELGPLTVIYIDREDKPSIAVWDKVGKRWLP